MDEVLLYRTKYRGRSPPIQGIVDHSNHQAFTNSSHPSPKKDDDGIDLGGDARPRPRADDESCVGARRGGAALRGTGSGPGCGPLRLPVDESVHSRVRVCSHAHPLHGRAAHVHRRSRADCTHVPVHGHVGAAARHDARLGAVDCGDVTVSVEKDVHGLSRNTEPRASSVPFMEPDTEKGWHGNPHNFFSSLFIHLPHAVY